MEQIDDLLEGVMIPIEHLIAFYQDGERLAREERTRVLNYLRLTRGR
jgi:hypothetical protein